VLSEFCAINKNETTKIKTHGNVSLILRDKKKRTAKEKLPIYRLRNVGSSHGRF
jgi:hypothetical protein